jgi:MFS family permease
MSEAASNWALLCLLLVYVSNQWCRYLLNYLYAVSSDDPKQSLEAATGITTAQYGLLVGFGFSFTYVLIGLVMGRAADVCNRVNIIAVGLVLWSVAVLQMGFANSFTALLISRVVLGIGESFSGPASYSLIADFFAPAERARANGIYAFGVYVGGGLGSLSLAMARGIGWRTTCWILASIGGFLAVLLRGTVREPVHTGKAVSGSSAKPAQKAEEQLTVVQSLREILGTKLVVAMLVAGSARFMAGYCLGAYLPVFYKAQFPSYNKQYSYINASVVSLGGAASSYAGGVAADKWEQAGQSKAHLYVPAIGAALAIPTLALALYSTNFYLR